MAGPTIAADFNKALDVKCNITAQIAFHFDIVFDVFTKFRDIFFGQILDTSVGIDTCCGNNVACRLSADTVDICETDFDSLVSR